MRLGPALATMIAMTATGGCGRAAVRAPICADDDCDLIGYAPLAEKLTAAGVPHTAMIDSVAISSDGRVAMTRDRRGGARLWTELDGSMEPISVPIGAVAQMSVDTNGELVAIAIVDASGSAQLMTYDGVGFTVHASLPPHAGIREMHVTAGGRRIIALGNDDTVRLYTITGDELDRWQSRGSRLSHLLVSSSPVRAVAVSIDDANAVRLTLTANLARLRALGDAANLELPTADPPRKRAQFALSPDGDLLAYVTGGQDEAFTLRTLHFDTGSAIDTFLPISTDAVPTLGFTDTRTILTGDRTSQSLWRFDVSSSDIDGDEIPVHAHQAVVPAYGSNKRIGARSTWLMVHSLADDSTRYLGYDTFSPRRAAISPNNQHVAWAAERSVFIEPTNTDAGADGRVHLDQSKAVRGTLAGLFFYDDAYLIEVDTAGQLLLVEWRTGEVIDAVDTRQMHTVAHYQRDTHVLEVRTPEGLISYGVDHDIGFVSPVDVPRRAAANIPALDIERRASVVRRIVSSDARSVALVRSDGFIDVYDTATRARLWSYSTGDSAAWAAEWAPDDSTLAVAGATGAAILRARDGAIVYKRCATHFMVRAIVLGGRADDPPASICE